MQNTDQPPAPIPKDVLRYYAHLPKDVFWWYRDKALGLRTELDKSENGKAPFDVRGAIVILAPFSLECMWVRLSESEKEKLQTITEELRERYGALEAFA